MSSYAQNHVHLVFSTKGRRKHISKEAQPRLWRYIAGICKNNAMTVFAVGGMDDLPLKKHGVEFDPRYVFG